MADVVAARAAKEHAAALLRDHPSVNGVGVARHGDEFCVRVDLLEAVESGSLPADVDGVPVESRVVGPARAQGA